MRQAIPALFLLASPAVLAADNFIEVQGQGTVHVVPDQMVLNLTVEQSGGDLSTLRDQVNTTSQLFIDYLLNEKEVNERHLQSYRVQVHPQFRHDDGRPEQIGYSVRRNIQLTLVNPAHYSDILDKALDLNIDRIHNVQYMVSESSLHVQNALKLAVADARSKAEALAEASGSDITGVLQITEHGSHGGFARTMAMDSAELNQPGQQDVNARVTIRFAIDD